MEAGEGDILVTDIQVNLGIGNVNEKGKIIFFISEKWLRDSRFKEREVYYK